MTYEERAAYEADILRLQRANTKLFIQFAACSRHTKALKLEIGYLQSEKAELQYQIEQLTKQAA